jgi:hypothetical protein
LNTEQNHETHLGEALVIMNPGKEPLNVTIEKPSKVILAGFEKSKLQYIIDVLMS